MKNIFASTVLPSLLLALPACTNHRDTEPQQVETSVVSNIAEATLRQCGEPYRIEESQNYTSYKFKCADGHGRVVVNLMVGPNNLQIKVEDAPAARRVLGVSVPDESIIAPKPSGLQLRHS